MLKRKYQLPVCLLLCLILTTSLFSFAGCSKKPEKHAAKATTEAASETADSEETSKEPETEPVKTVDAGSSDSLFTFSLFENDQSYSPEDIEVQKEFEEFLKENFTESYKDGSASVNLLIKDVSTFGIERIPSKWPNMDYSSYADDLKEDEEDKKTLESFSYDSLTGEQQFIYDLLCYNYDTEKLSPDSYLFTSPFSLNGILPEIPLVLTEYHITGKEDIDAYIDMLNTLPDYLQACIDYEKNRIAAKHYNSGYSYESNLEVCETFLSEGKEYITNAFTKLLDNYPDLTKEEKKSYLKQCEDALDQKVLPAYQNLSDTLTSFREQYVFNRGLSYVNGGKDYFRYLLAQDVGTDKSPEELITLLDDAISGYKEEFSSILLSDLSLYEKIEEPEYIYTEPKEILSYLSEKLEEDFPKAVCKNYTLNSVHPVLADELTAAFYILSPIDDYQNNHIYVNNDKVGTFNDSFATLAHEGLPGHMYQHNYFWSTNPSYIRMMLQYTGYSEGWAEYIECYSYDWAGLDENVARCLQINTLLNNALPARVDLGVNWEGWDLEDTASYLSDIGIDDEETVTTLYETAVSAPAVFQTYIIGYLELQSLKDEAEEKLGDHFRLKDFHKFYLEIGPSAFPLLRERMESWTEKILSQTTD